MKTQKLLVIVVSVCLMAFFNVLSFAQTTPVQSVDVQPNQRHYLQGMLQAEGEDDSQCLTIIGALVDFVQNQQDTIDECEAQLAECEGMQENFAAVPRTGQTRSDAAGDDGDLQKGVAWPEQRFTDNGNGTVTDHLTGLVWTQNQCAASLGIWTEAVQYVNESVYDDGGEFPPCGLRDGSQPGDWRLPNVRELQSLLDFGRTAPPLPSGHPFDFDSSDWGGYWTSTPGNCIPLTPNCWDDMAWVVFINTNSPDVIALCKKEPSEIPGQFQCDIPRPEFGGFGRIWPVRGGN